MFRRVFQKGWCYDVVNKPGRGGTAGGASKKGGRLPADHKQTVKIFSDTPPEPNAGGNRKKSAARGKKKGGGAGKARVGKSGGKAGAFSTKHFLESPSRKEKVPQWKRKSRRQKTGPTPPESG